jgi:hypothetical protein
MLSERESRELREIERFLVVDTRLADAMRCQRLPRKRRPVSNWMVSLIAVALTATIFCAVLGSAVGAVICATTTVAVLGLSAALPTHRGSARNGL